MSFGTKDSSAIHTTQIFVIMTGQTIKSMLKKYLKPEILIFIISWLAVLGSLYIGHFGDPVANLKTLDLFNSGNAIPPCDLCWYQRILIYPIAVVSSIGFYLKHRKSIYYIFVFALLNTAVALYHIYIQETGFSIIPCGLGRPCNVKEFEYLGFITMPVLSVLTSLTILILSILGIKKLKNPTE